VASVTASGYEIVNPVAITAFAAVIGALAATIAAVGGIFAAMRSAKNAQSIQEVHMTMNSRLDQLLNASIAQARSEGHAQGMAESLIDPAVTAKAAADVLATARDVVPPLPALLVMEAPDAGRPDPTTGGKSKPD
jgi:hypothetical protein